MPIMEWDLQAPVNYDWALEIAREEFTTSLARAGEGLKAAIGRQFVLDDAIATGKTAKSFQVSEVEDLGDRFQVFVYPIGDRARVAEFLETGTQPSSNRPSPDAVRNIMAWMRARHITPNKGKNTPTNLKAAAFAIGVAILENGLEPRFLVEQAETHYARYIQQIMDGAARRTAKRINALLGSEDTGE